MGLSDGQRRAGTGVGGAWGGRLELYSQWWQL